MVVAEGTDNAAVGVFAIREAGGLGFLDGVCAREQVAKLPVAVGIGGGRQADRVAVCICAGQGNCYARNANLAVVLHAVVVCINVDSTRNTRGCITEANGGWVASTHIDRHTVTCVLARAKTVGLGFNHTVVACGQVREAVVSTCISQGCGRLDTWGGWIAINIVAVHVFQGNQHTWDTNLVWIEHTVGIRVFVDLTLNGVAQLTEVITRALDTSAKRDARDLVIGERSGGCAVAVFAVVVQGWLGFDDGVGARLQTFNLPVATCIGGGGDRNIRAVNVSSCDQDADVWNARLTCLLGTVVVVVSVNLTCQAGRGFTKVDWGDWCTCNNRHRDDIGWVLTRAVTGRLSLFDGVGTCNLWWEVVIAVLIGHGAGDDGSSSVLQDHGHAW